jgi:hypothetical protein
MGIPKIALFSLIVRPNEPESFFFRLGLQKEKKKSERIGHGELMPGSVLLAFEKRKWLE